MSISNTNTNTMKCVCCNIAQVLSDFDQSSRGINLVCKNCANSMDEYPNVFVPIDMAPIVLIPNNMLSTLTRYNLKANLTAT